MGDAALGNVTAAGAHIADVKDKVHSQAAYLIMYGDKDLVAGKTGRFAPMDGRSHRLQRVCRASYTAETLGLEEAVDAAQLIRGLLAEVRDYLMQSKMSAESRDRIPCTAVVDAKDTHENFNFWCSKVAGLYSLQLLG